MKKKDFDLDYFLVKGNNVFSSAYTLELFEKIKKLKDDDDIFDNLRQYDLVEWATKLGNKDEIKTKIADGYHVLEWLKHFPEDKEFFVDKIKKQEIIFSVIDLEDWLKRFPEDLELMINYAKVDERDEDSCGEFFLRRCGYDEKWYKMLCKNELSKRNFFEFFLENHKEYFLLETVKKYINTDLTDEDLELIKIGLLFLKNKEILEILDRLKKIFRDNVRRFKKFLL